MQTQNTSNIQEYDETNLKFKNKAIKKPNIHRVKYN